MHVCVYVCVYVCACVCVCVCVCVYELLFILVKTLKTSKMIQKCVGEKVTFTRCKGINYNLSLEWLVKLCIGVNFVTGMIV